VNVGYWSQNNKNPKTRGICLGWAAECRQMGTKITNDLYDISVQEEEEVPEEIAEGSEDEASAVGDPHITTNSNQHFDMSLLQEDEVPVQIGSNKRCREKNLARGTFDTADACIAEFKLRGDIVNVGYWSQNNKNPKTRGICLGWAAECRQMGTKITNDLYDISVQEEEEVPEEIAEGSEDEASAVGDPHITTNSNQHFDMSTPSSPFLLQRDSGDDGASIAADAWALAHVGIAADARVGRDLFVETCVSGSSFPDSSSFRTYLNNVFDLGLAMMLPTVKSDLGRHCFSYGYILSKEFYGDEPLDVMDFKSNDDLDALFGAVAKDADGRVTASAFKAAMHAKLDPGHSAEEVAALDTYLDKVFTTSLSMMLPASKTTLGSHCFRYAAMAAGEFYFSGNAADAFGLVTPAAVVAPSVGEDGSTITADAWSQAHDGIAAYARVGRDLFVETCASGSSLVLLQRMRPVA